MYNKLSIAVAFLVAATHAADYTCSNEVISESYDNVYVSTGSCTLSGANVTGSIQGSGGFDININGGTYVGGNININGNNKLTISGSQSNLVKGGITSNGIVRVEDGATVEGNIGVTDSFSFFRVWQSTVNYINVQNGALVAIKGSTVKNGIRVVGSGKVRINRIVGVGNIIENGNVQVHDNESVKIVSTEVVNGALDVTSNESLLMEDVYVKFNAQVSNNANPGNINIIDTTVDGTLTVQNNNDVSITGSDGNILTCQSNTNVLGSDNDFTATGSAGSDQCDPIYTWVHNRWKMGLLAESDER